MQAGLHLSFVAWLAVERRVAVVRRWAAVVPGWSQSYPGGRSRTRVVALVPGWVEDGQQCQLGA